MRFIPTRVRNTRAPSNTTRPLLFLGDNLPIRLLIGAFAGLVVGVLVSGAVLLVLGFKRKS